MVKKGLLFFILQVNVTLIASGQNLNLDKYDVSIYDSLISKSEFIKNGKSLDSSRLKQLTFNPIVDGIRKVYYLNGKLHSEGEIKNQKEEGFWIYWHENGTKAREGSFKNGKREGTHKYWYPNGTIRGEGNFKGDQYDGKWTMYKEDGSEVVEQYYKGGQLVKKE